MKEPICSRKHCGEPAIGTNTEREDLCFDHMTDWQIEQDLFETDEHGRKRTVMRNARAM